MLAKDFQEGCYYHHKNRGTVFYSEQAHSAQSKNYNPNTILIDVIGDGIQELSLYLIESFDAFKKS